MSNQSSVYNEKKIAAYESLFKESSFAKPQEVYLTITVGHVFGQAYIMEQQGTKEGDPVYSRFVCPLEEITKVYINDSVKASPLFIQCDTDVKGVIHRKRIIVPCLDNVASIVEQIKEVRAQRMEKYEAVQEREKNKKREALEAARMKERQEIEAKKQIHSLPEVLKISEPVEAPKPADEIKKTELTQSSEPVKSVETEKGSETEKTVQNNNSLQGKPVTSAKSVLDLSSEIEKSLKAFESFENAAKVNTDVKPLPKKPGMNLENISDAASVLEKSKEPEINKNVVPEVMLEPISEAITKIKEDKTDSVSASDLSLEEISETIEEIPDVPELEEDIPEPSEIDEIASNEKIPELNVDEIDEIDVNSINIEEISEIDPLPPVEDDLIEPLVVSQDVLSRSPAVNTETVTKIKRVNPNGTAIALNDFESLVKELKAKKDRGEISAQEFSDEKKKLVASLY